MEREGGGNSKRAGSGRNRGTSCAKSFFLLDKEQAGHEMINTAL